MGRFTDTECILSFLFGFCVLFYPLSFSGAHTDLPVDPDDRALRRHTHSIPPQYAGEEATEARFLDWMQWSKTGNHVGREMVMLSRRAVVGLAENTRLLLVWEASTYANPQNGEIGVSIM